MKGMKGVRPNHPAIFQQLSNKLEIEQLSYVFEVMNINTGGAIGVSKIDSSDYSKLAVKHA